MPFNALTDQDIAAQLAEFDERGSNLFTSEGGAFAMYKKLGTSTYFQFTFTPTNSPSVQAGTIEMSEEKLVEHIQTNLWGWHARKCHLDVELDNNGYVIELDEE